MASFQDNLGKSYQNYSGARSDGGGSSDNWNLKSLAKLQSGHHYQHTHTWFLQSRCPSCLPTNSVKGLKASVHKICKIKN